MTENVVYKVSFVSSTKNVSITTTTISLRTSFYFISTKVGDKQTNKTQVYSLSHNCAAILAERKPLGQFNTNRISVLMIKSSVEYLNSFRRVMPRDFIPFCDILPPDYEAMYAYKCGLYEKCFRLSQESVDFVKYSTCCSWLKY